MGPVPGHGRPNPFRQGSCAEDPEVDSESGMSAVPPMPDGRGLALLAAHCASLDPDAPNARERLETMLGAELAQRLVSALSRGAPAPTRFAA